MAESYVTQSQVAKRADVHQTTVSLVFRNHPSVPAATRERVLAAARELGYKRHPLLAALMSTRLRLSPGTGSPVLAFLTDFDRKDRWRESPTAVEMFTGARRRAQELGYRVETFWLADPEMPPERTEAILKARNIHGLLLAPTHQPRALLTFNFAPFSVVGLGVSNETASMLSVAHDHFNGMRNAVQHCLAVGRRRVAVMLTVEANDVVRDKWLAAYALECEAAGGPPRLPVWQGPCSPTEFAAWLKRVRPAAVVGTFTDELRQYCRRHDSRAVRDVAFVSLSVRQDERWFAGIHQRSETIGERAVDLVVSALNHNQAGLLPMHQVLHIEGEWRPAPSLRAARKGRGRAGGRGEVGRYAPSRDE